MFRNKIVGITRVIRNTLLAVIVVLAAVYGLLRNFQESTRLTVIAVVVTILFFTAAVSAYIYLSKTAQKRHQFTKKERKWALAAFWLTISCTIVALLLKDVRAYVMAAFEGPTGTCPYTEVAASDDRAIQWLIKREAQAVADGRLDQIKEVFSPSALIVDYGNKNNPVEFADPYAHYAELFNTAQYDHAVNDHIKMLMIRNDGTAYYTSASHGDGMGRDGKAFAYKNPDNANHWTAKKINGCWKIIEFDFNASDIPFPVGVEFQ